MERHEIIERKWQFLLDNRNSERFGRVVVRASQESALRALYPYRSLNNLRFSHKVEYPYDRMPYIRAEDCLGEEFEAVDATNELLARGDLDTVIVALVPAVKALPEGIEPPPFDKNDLVREDL